MLCCRITFRPFGWANKGTKTRIFEKKSSFPFRGIVARSVHLLYTIVFMLTVKFKAIAREREREIQEEEEEKKTPKNRHCVVRFVSLIFFFFFTMI